MSENPENPPKRSVEAPKLIASGTPVSHRVEKTWRSFRIFQKEKQFFAKLTSLAELPAPDKLAVILGVATKNELPEIARRAGLSKLEDEFLELIAALISAEEKRWIPLLRKFLADHGWKADLRGSPTKHPVELADRRRGEIIDGIVTELEGGFALKLKARKGYLGSNEVIKPKLQKLGYDDAQANAILRRRKLSSAACDYYRTIHEPKRPLRSILNSYGRYSKSKVHQSRR
jgi:hypothetical protein